MQAFEGGVLVVAGMGLDGFGREVQEDKEGKGTSETYFSCVNTSGGI